MNIISIEFNVSLALHQNWHADFKMTIPLFFLYFFSLWLTLWTSTRLLFVSKWKGGQTSAFISLLIRNEIFQIWWIRLKFEKHDNLLLFLEGDLKLSYDYWSIKCLDWSSILKTPALVSRLKMETVLMLWCMKLHECDQNMDVAITVGRRFGVRRPKNRFM